MMSAANKGGIYTQAASLAIMVSYFLKGNTIKLKFIYGFFYVYWWNHIFTLGSYSGMLFKMPSTICIIFLRNLQKN
jgi:hypothetical protein